MLTNTKIPAIIIMFLLGIFLAAAWFGYKQLSMESTDPLQAFPKNTAFVLEIPQPEEFFSKLNNENAFWIDLLSHKKINEFSIFFNEILAKSQNDEKLKSFFNQAFYLALISTDEKSTDFLLITKQNGFNLESLNQKLLSRLNGIQYSSSDNDTVFAKITTTSSSYFLAQSNDLFFISSNPKAIQIAKNQISEEKGFIISSDFNQLKTTRGKRADAYLYIAYNSTPQALKNLLREEGITQLKTSSFANYSVLDVILKKDELLLNGYTSAFDSLNQYLTAFQNQKGQKSQLAISLPYSTESFIGINLSDYHSFIEKQTTLSQLQKSRTAIDNLINEKSLAITAQWWAGEMALVIDNKQREYAVFTAKSNREAFRLLADIAHQSQPRIITETYRDQKIKEINSPHFLISQFGPLFSGFKEVYFCVIDEAVIFSKNIPDLKSYIDALILGNNLSKNEDYIEFSDNLSDDAIIRIYSKTPKISHPIFDLFLSEGKPLFKNFGNLLKNIKGIGIQISNKNDLFYTGIFVNHGENRIEKSSVWQVELDAEITAGPFLIKNHTTGGNSILVQDKFNTLYLLNAKGDIVWTQTLEETIQSQVFSVDFYKNGKWQYLFNSPNFLYLIDINGNPVADYPIQLNSEATNGLQVLDYDNKKEYRLLIAAKNGELYNYELNGRLLKGWKAENTRKEISKPLTHLVANKKDYLIFEASNGNIIMTDRRGNKRMEIRKSFTNALGSDIYVNRTNSRKGMMITTDSEGNLIYIPEKGAINRTSFGKMSENHFFLYTDFDKNTEMDFIYQDGNKLLIFDKFKNIILSYDFANSIALKPQLFSIDNQMILGVIDQIEKQLYLFDKNGLLIDKIRKGDTPFVTGKLNINGAQSLLIGFEKSIFNYPLN